MAASGKNEILSSAPLQVLLYLNCWYFGAFFIAELLMFVYKGVLLPYPPANLILDIVLLFLFLGLEILRIFYGWKGNLCEQTLALVLSVGVLVPCTVLSVYFLLLQTFVLRLEVIINAVLLCFYGPELLLGLTTLGTFSRCARGYGEHCLPSWEEVPVGGCCTLRRFLFTSFLCVFQEVGVCSRSTKTHQVQLGVLLSAQNVEDSSSASAPRRPNTTETNKLVFILLLNVD
ncbi:transmembrane protein 216-like isoform X2 [Arapaima gigas]